MWSVVNWLLSLVLLPPLLLLLLLLLLAARLPLACHLGQCLGMHGALREHSVHRRQPQQAAQQRHQPCGSSQLRWAV